MKQVVIFIIALIDCIRTLPHHGFAYIVMKFSYLLIEFTHKYQADLNPFRVHNDGNWASVLDARIFLEKMSRGGIEKVLRVWYK
jgi:hypothetical protein